MTLEAIMEGMIAADKTGENSRALHTVTPRFRRDWRTNGLACGVKASPAKWFRSVHSRGMCGASAEFTVHECDANHHLTRIEGRTPVPSLKPGNAGRASLCDGDFLSVKQIERCYRKTQTRV
jgi:hypothetical protein